MYDLGCKGGTIYRDGSRDEQILATDHKKLGKDAAQQVESAMSADDKSKKGERATQEVMSISGDNVQIKLAPRERPAAMMGITYKMNTAYGNLYITVNEDEHGPFEVFAQMGKAGGFFSAQTEAITRMISLALRSNVAIEEIIAQLKGIRGPDVSFSEDGMVFSLPDAISKILEKHIKRNQQQLALELPERPAAKLSPSAPASESAVMETVVEEKIKTNGEMTYKATQKVSIANLGNAPVCPSCSNMLIMAEGCMKCDFCGYSKCG